MHTDERIELRNNFLNYMNEHGWNEYLISEKKIVKRVNILFRMFHLLFVASVLAIAFASMRKYIGRVYGWAALGGVVIWLFIERINLNKIDDLFLRKKQIKLIEIFKNDNIFLEKIKQFSKLDMITDQQYEHLLKSLTMENKNSSKMWIEEMKKTIITLNSIKPIEEMPELIIEEKEDYYKIVESD